MPTEPKPRFLTEGEILTSIDWWQAKRDKSERWARWFEAAAVAFRDLARSETIPDTQRAHLIIEAQNAEAEAAPLKQVGVLKLKELKEKLAEMRTQPMAGVIDGSVEK